jgi:hypothetical protein
MDRRARLYAVLSEGSGLSGEALENMYDPASDPQALRAAEDTKAYGTESMRHKHK